MILKKFKVENRVHPQKPTSEEEKREMELISYSNIVGSIMYMMICTGPYIANAISTTSRYKTDFGRQRWSAVKWTLRYLNGANKLGILFTGAGGEEEEPLVGFYDSGYATNLETRRSQTSYVFTLFGSEVFWNSSLQNVAALSTTEAEYINLTSAAKERKWLMGLISDFGIEQKGVTVHYEQWSHFSIKHQMLHERSKHIDVRLHFIRDEVESGRVREAKIDTAHMLTKSMSKEKFEYCCKLVNVCVADL